MPLSAWCMQVTVACLSTFCCRKPEMRRGIVQDGGRSAEDRQTPNPWPISEWTMADQAEINGACLLLLAPALWGRAPNGIAHSVAVHTRCVFARALGPHCMGQVYPCIPLAPLTPVLSVTGDNFAFSWFFCPATHRACRSSPIPNPAALHLRGTQSSKISAARGGSKPAAASSLFTNTHTDLPIFTNPPLLTSIRHSRLSLLGLVPSFCLSSFSSSKAKNTPRKHQTVDRLATGPTSQPKHRMSGSHNVRHHHHHPPLC